MKELFVKNVVNETTDFLDNNQRIKLKEILTEICIYYRIEKLEQSKKEEMQRNNEDILNRFISSKEIEGCSTRTLNYYSDNISKMLNTVNLPINEITTETLRNYLADYKSNSSAGMVTIDNIRRTLSSFFAWLENEDYIVKSPVRRIHKVKTTRRVKETLTDENLEKLRDTCSNVRDSAILELLISTGMRVGELTRLNIADMNFQERSCIVLGKGNCEREVYFSAKSKMYIKKYLETRTDNNSTKQIMATLNNSKNKGNILLENIIYKKVDREISQFIARNCHYLHTPRNDEFVSYGAFVEGQALPVAWVSFSKQDREYKKQLLYYLGIEPQNTLEMTRAWCSNSAPQNIMSSLFQYSINEAEQEWKKLKEQREVNKNLQAITTTINPNLGFKASSFMGCNFIPFALRPAKFTYGRQKNATEYMTRREIERNNLDYVENQFNVLPLNEIILCMDKRKQEEISRGKIYTMDKKNYNLVLEGEMNGKDIDSDQKQR